MSEFHNPYHFVPVSATAGPGSHPLPGSRAASGLPPHVAHDRFLAGDPAAERAEFFSGGMVVRLTIEELAGVGADQTPGTRQKPRQVQLFRQSGVWAIPGSSLRGLLSALAEAASNSTLRVLEDAPIEVYTDPRGRYSKRPIGSVHEVFRAVSPELVPLQTNDEREALTLAEQMFGLVEQVPEGTRPPAHRDVLAFAGRLRVSNALLHGPSPATVEGRLKILDSPKAANSNFCFRPKSADGFVSKADLSPAKHQPHGRKFYLHRAALRDEDWLTHPDLKDVRVEQKADVEALDGGELWFSIGFENFSRAELELLCYAVRPHKDFRHKLGFAKPLGLGKVRLDPFGLLLVNRQGRYKDNALGADRYAALWRADGITDWPPRYRAEANAQAASTCASPADWAAAWSARVAKEAPALSETLRALELLGDPARAPGDVPVHYPQPMQRGGETIEQYSPEMEDKGYEWFQRNQEQAGQYLRSLDSTNTGSFKRLPTLDRNARSEPPLPPKSPPPPPGAPIAQPANPQQAHGRTLKFVLSARGPNRKPVFTITLGGVSYRGFVGPNDALKLQKVEMGEAVNLKVVNFNAGTFQLTLPPAQ